MKQVEIGLEKMKTCQKKTTSNYICKKYGMYEYGMT